MSLPLVPGASVGLYEVRGRLGSGALGIVYRARQASLDRDVALKVLAPALSVDEDLVERFQREAKTAAALRHPNIVTIYDTGFAGGYHYIAMELLPGGTLSQLPLPLDPAEAAEIARQLCEALAYAHRQGVIHRDLKPENALIDDSGHATLTDFGIARVVGQASLTLGGGPVGTPEFMAPEQARGEADARSDVYSLGLVLYVLLTGVSPFLAESAVATMYRQIHAPLPPLPGALPAPLRSWVDRCCQKSPADRFANGEEALTALKQAIAVSFPSALAAGDPAARPSDPLGAILRGEMTLSEALDLHRDHEAEIRSAFQREATALSLDIVRSTLLKEPGRTILASFTFSAFRRFVQGILDRRGCIASIWSGDGLMALFTSADAGVSAAEEILEGLPGFNASGSGLQDPVQVRIGIHSGRILMSEGQTLAEVASPTLDTAGRLQKQAPPDGVLLSTAAHSRLSQPGDWQPLPSVPNLPVGVMGPPDQPQAAPGLSGPNSQVTRVGGGRDRAVDPGAASRQLEPFGRLESPGQQLESAHQGIAAGFQAQTLAGRSGEPGLHASHPPGLPPVPAHGSFGAMIPSETLPAAPWVMPGWSLLTFIATVCTLARAGEMVVAPLWIAGIVWAASAMKQRARLAPLALTLSILGIILAFTDQSGVPMPLMIPICLGMAIAAVVGERHSRRLSARRGFVVLDPTSHAPALPPPARDRLLDELAAHAGRLGFAPRQLGIRLYRSMEGAVLHLQAEAVNRDSGQVLAVTSVRGDLSDSEGLASDIARQLAAQLQPPPLSPSLSSPRLRSGNDRPGE